MSILARLRRWIAGFSPPPGKGPPPGMYESPLDKLGNRTADAIDAGDFKKAEKLCRSLLHEYPTAFDGHQRMGELREAQGRFREAAEEYSKVLEQIKASPNGTDQETIRFVTEDRDRALAKAKG